MSECIYHEAQIYPHVKDVESDVFFSFGGEINGRTKPCLVHGDVDMYANLWENLKYETFASVRALRQREAVSAFAWGRVTLKLLKRSAAESAGYQ